VIKLPRRSVTRFFIPLIDVLILLFCIFLLMPFVSGPATTEAPDTKAAPKEPLPTNVLELQRELTEARDRLKRMEAAAQARINDRLSVRVLQVGKDRNGVFLYYFDPDRQEIRTESDALKLIALQKTIASKAGGVKDVLFLIMYPRDAAGNELGYPNRDEEKVIRSWFREVPLKFEY
jgi:hypothetical protein